MEFTNRHTIRLKGYDYSQPGNYFVTICVHKRLHIFGEIINREMVLNDIGYMICRQWYELQDRFLNIELHDYVIMKNHLM